MSMEGRVAIVTGAAKGIGRGVARTLAREGADIVIVDINLQGAQQVADEIQAGGRKTLAMKVDISCKRDVLDAVEATIETFDRIDILVNNAGIAEPATVEDLSEEDWDRTININLKGPFLFSQAVIPQMKKQGGGRIVNISSIAGKIGGICAGPAYAASKAGVMCLTKSFSKALAKFNILVNSVSPGQIDTDLNKLFPEDMNRIFMEAIPLGHYGQPEDIAEAVAFLCSDKARWITGEIFNVDGGEAAMVS
ncbi:MAG: SDR family NAD(P)-dependent oxidoreductase [Lentisphaeria bacterium]|nr:SDR family NAD(P)-dependent oxidoreductase [Lentisphaeria bacterium]